MYAIQTHIDIVEDFTSDLITRLVELAKQYDFLIFGESSVPADGLGLGLSTPHYPTEDRKFADIGNTVSLQYSSGIYKIADWAHITNAHSVAGEGTIAGLKKVGLSKQRGLLLLAEMSSAGALTKGDYTRETIEIAKRNQDFVLGFIAQRQMSKPEDEDDFLVLTPGVQLKASAGSLGQQYRTPQQVIEEDGCDVIIVGKGIYEQPERIAEAAKEYRDAGWSAYQSRCA